jgi:two-component system sensor histidine kinase EvgS
MKSALLAHVSHELRTPLQGILGYAELLAGRPLDEEQRGWLSAQRRQGELLQRLVNDLIDLGALQSGAFTFAARPARLTSLVEETVLSLRPRAHIRQLTLDLDADPALPAWLVFDPDRLRQVLLNLVGNAIKFTAEGGVVVNLRLVTADAVTARVEIAVADTGPGIAPADQARLFRPFTRLEGTRQHEGAGLGLALAHGLCVGMGGTLAVESDGRTGTTFRARLDLPVAIPPPPTGESPAKPVPAHAGVTLIVADDNTLVRELYLAHFSAQGAACTGVADGLAAVAAVLTARPPVDVLVLDLAMPQLDGLAVARRLRAEGPAGLRIIGASAHGNPEHRQRALAAGMDDFLVKPVKLSELSRCVQRQLGRAVPLTGGSQLPAALRQKLREIFTRETPVVLAALDAAFAANDWATLEARAHYLKNSAHVLTETDLAGCCEAIVVAARARAAEPASAHLAALRDRLEALARS